MFIPFSNQGSDALTFNIIVPGMSYLAQSWCNLVGAINPISVILIVYWICSVWLMAFGYLLRDELNWLWEKFKQLLKYLYHGLFPVVL
jgi:hypothetical protein